MKKVVISIVVVVAIGLVVCLVPLKDAAYTVMVDYQDTAPLSYEVIQAEGGTRYVTGYPSGGGALTVIGLESVYQVTLNNTDDIAGTFTVQISFEKTSEKRSQSIYLKPGEEGSVLFENLKSYLTVGKLTWEVIPEAKTITKQRPETHCKKVTLLDYWLQ